MTDPIRPSRRVVFHGISALGAAGVLAGCGGSDNGGGQADDTAASGATGGGADGGGSGSGGADPLARTSEVPVGGGVVLTEDQIVVTQPADGEFRAFSAVCTHQGCTVREVDDTINCPCHGSSFTLEDGSPTGGPAPSALPPVEIEVRGGRIFRA